MEVMHKVRIRSEHALGNIILGTTAEKVFEGV